MTFCENYVPWTYKLEPLAAELDFISVHTYPAWEYRTMEDALEFTKQNYHSVVNHYPGKPVVITEAGWTTTANGRGIDPHNFCANDDMAAGVLRVAMRRGIRVPHELSIAGCDDIALCQQLYPSLTTIRQPLSAMAEIASQALIDASRGKSDKPAYHINSREPGDTGIDGAAAV